ncbi:MAG TPA: hypothetical protein VGG28_01050, partial [Kofleriaceae bacterium]
FTGLSSLNGVAGNFVVLENANLDSFAGLTSFTHVNGSVDIESNPNLPAATAQAFVNEITVRGSVTIN